MSYLYDTLGTMKGPKNGHDGNLWNFATDSTEPGLQLLAGNGTGPRMIVVDSLGLKYSNRTG